MFSSYASMRRTLTVTVLLGGLALAACGGDDGTTAGETTAPTATSTAAIPTTAPTGADPAGAATAPNEELDDADVEFAQRMIAHHEQAIEMAEIALDPARQAGVEVVALAGRVEAGQDPEIDTMSDWLATAGEPVQMDMSDGHDMSEMTGMMSAEDMDALGTKTGAEFDDMWLTMMVGHHEGAIEMAIAIDDEGTHPDVEALARQIVAAQQAEVDEMQQLLAS